MRLLLLASAILLSLNGCSDSGSDSNAARPDMLPGALEAQSDSSDIKDSNSAADSGINLNNYESIAKEVIAVLNLRGIDVTRLAARERSRQVAANNDAVLAGEPASLPTLALASQTPVEGDGHGIPVINELVYTCENAGTLTSLDYDYAPAPFTARDVVYDNCLFNNVTSSGGYKFSSGRRSSTIDTFHDYHAQSNGITQSLHGTWEYKYPWIGQGSSQLWTDATITSSDTTSPFRIDNFNWSNVGIDHKLPPPNGVRGFVLDAEGVVRPVRLHNYQAYIRSSFTLTSNASNQLPISVDVEMQFENDYFVWEQLFVEGLPIVPDYPVSDLGSPLTLSSSADFDNAHTIIMLDQREKDRQAQWQSGQLRIVAEDGSELVLKPNANDKSQLQIELSGEASPVNALWADGFQVECVSIIEGCGRFEPRLR